MQLETSEPITITVSDDVNMVVVKVDGMDYAVIDNITMSELDADALIDWVNNTYYDHDFGIGDVCYLHAKNFRNQV